MRGSVYYQTSLLCKAVFAPGAKKWMRTTPEHPHYQKVASYKTLETYRRVWDDLGSYVKEEFGLKDLSLLTAWHIESFMLTKVYLGPSKQYLEKLSSAIGKLETALQFFSRDVLGQMMTYDFSIRQSILDGARDAGLVRDGYHDRAYSDPESIIKRLPTLEQRLAARIQLTGGPRFEGIGLIKPSQLKGEATDPVTGRQVCLLETKEKGGKVGDVYLPPEFYAQLQHYLAEHRLFVVDRTSYMTAIRETCLTLGITPEGSHAFRWSFAQARFKEYQRCGYTYEQARQGLSLEMKHNRPAITDHYC